MGLSFRLDYLRRIQDQNQGEYGAHYAEEIFMRALGFLICIVIFAVGLPSAEGFITSQEHQWQQDLNEAKSRARDFEKYLERNRTSSRVREAAADEIKAEREEMEKRAERARREFVRERENRPSLDAVYEKLEKEH